jgi:hypothetical protein
MKAQFSLELMLAFAAYAALVASLVAAVNHLNAEGKDRKSELVDKAELEAVCTVLDSFAANARNTAMKLELNSSRYSVGEDGRSISLGGASKSNASAKCLSRIRGRGTLEVEENEREST